MNKQMCPSCDEYPYPSDWLEANRQVNILRQQRDELLAALKDILNDIRTPSEGVEYVMLRRSITKSARALIARIKG